jgi:hypothetical protein
MTTPKKKPQMVNSDTVKKYPGKGGSVTKVPGPGKSNPPWKLQPKHKDQNPPSLMKKPAVKKGRNTKGKI